MTMRKNNIRMFIKDEKEGYRDYSHMAKITNNPKFKKMYEEMARDEKKHLKMLEKILKQEPCEKQNVIRKRRRRYQI